MNTNHSTIKKFLSSLFFLIKKGTKKSRKFESFSAIPNAWLAKFSFQPSCKENLYSVSHLPFISLN